MESLPANMTIVYNEFTQKPALEFGRDILNVTSNLTTTKLFQEVTVLFRKVNSSSKHTVANHHQLCSDKTSYLKSKWKGF